MDAVVTHTVHGSDREELAGFAARHLADGYQAAEPWSAGENLWVLSMWRSVTSDLGRREIEARCAAAGITYMREDTEHVMRDTATHDTQGAVKSSAKLSGNSYVSVRCRTTRARGKLLFMATDECNHGITICTECAESWEIDYEVRYSSTKAGRELSRQRADADSSAAHDRRAD
ncbi:hypothetical protein [Nocardia wallacei]|uniref:hypothetical protein n=1 Tax=Nocardia wallacei TaxID=480035 RepID=UPI0024581159|nr:hypothetical protein [Nocardia wallacei]